MTNLAFTHHAHDHMTERGVTQAEVYSAANEPDERHPSPKQQGKMIAEKQLETGHIPRSSCAFSYKIGARANESWMNRSSERHICGPDTPTGWREYAKCHCRPR